MSSLQLNSKLLFQHPSQVQICQEKGIREKKHSVVLFFPNRAFLMSRNKHHCSKIFGQKPQLEKEVLDREVTLTPHKDSSRR